MNKPYRVTDEQLQHMQAIAPANVDVQKDLNQPYNPIKKGVNDGAFVTGYNVDPETMGQASALRTEFIAPRLSQLSFGQDQMVFFNMIPKMPSASTVAQYVVTNEHGETGHSAWDDEVSISNPSAPVIERKLVRMKYASTTRQVSIPADAANNIETPIDVLTDDAIVSMAKIIEQGCLYGDADLSDLAPQGGAGQGLEPDGLIKYIPKENVVDKRGEDISINDFNTAAVMIEKAYGTPEVAFMPNGVLAHLNSNTSGFVQRQIMGNDNASAQAVLGTNVTAAATFGGNTRLVGSNVMENDNFLNEARLGGKGAPKAPSVTASVNADKTGLVGQFSQKDITSGLKYKVVVFADKVGSNASQEVDVAVKAATDTVSLTIQVPSVYEATPKYVAVYRQGYTTDDFYLLDRIPMYKATPGSTSSTLTFVDTNDSIPETADVFVGDMSPKTITLYEFLPMFRLPLPSMNKLLQFSIVWSGALAVIAPNRWVRFKNVGYTAVFPAHD